MTISRSILGCALLLSTLTGIAIACGDEEAKAPVSSEADTSDAAARDIVPADAASVVIHLYGGFGVYGFTPSDASTCGGSDQTFTIDLATRLFTWKMCERTGAEGDVLAFVEGSRTLEPPELDPVVASLRSFASAEKVLSRDGPMMELAVTTPRGTTSYQSCENGSRCSAESVSANGTWGLRNQLESLARRQ